ncbi:pancreatic triacylglycerol lipase-like [Periplaneta americana]|uniref:pancreatic triacylglycerol lipase-like n=1 Tax=Periplaneta americana TaxID=6978 RepID=UPI0037E8EB6C
MVGWYMQKTFLVIVIASLTSGASVRSPPSYLQQSNVILMPDDAGNLHVAYLTETSPRESTNITEDVMLLLFTRSNAGTDPNRLYVNDVNNLKASGYDPSHPTEILIHGFANNIQNSLLMNSKDVYLSKGEYNVIGVDWGVLCPAPLYAEACQNAVLVGQLLAELIDFLVEQGGAQLQDFHVTGHSLGAQVAGFTGSNTKTGKVGRITGLDAAYPMFGNVNASGRLDATDAVLVDIIHTCGGIFGFEEPIGHVDFYANGGRRPQPGCGEDLLGDCSHLKAADYFINSILNETAYPSVECLSLEEAESGTCTGTSTGYMGDAVQFGNPGLYYTDTTK